MPSYKIFRNFMGIALIAVVLASPTPGQPKTSSHPASSAPSETFSDCSFCLASSIRDLITPHLTAPTTSPAILSTLLQIRDNIIRTPSEATENKNSSPTDDATNITSTVFSEITTIIETLFSGQKPDALSVDSLTDALATIGEHIGNSISDEQSNIWDEIRDGVSGTLQSLDLDFDARDLNLRRRDEPGCAACILPEIATIVDRLTDVKRTPSSVEMNTALRVVKERIDSNITPEQRSALAYVKGGNLRAREACVFCAVSDIGDLVGGLLDGGLDSGSHEVKNALGDIQGKIDGLKKAIGG